MTTPYFYIIEDTTNSKFYAGVRTAAGCAPEELLTDNGYITSSKKIKDLYNNSKNSLKIIFIKSDFNDSEDALNYETKFLTENDCAGSDDWYNMHNNDYLSTWNSERYKKSMINCYGVDHISKIEEKKKETYIKNWGVPHYSKTDDFKLKCDDTYKKRTGHEWGKDPEQIAKTKETNKLNHGGIHSTQTEKFRKIVSENMSKRWSDPKLSENLKKKMSESFTNERKDILSKRSKEMQANTPNSVCEHCLKSVKRITYFRWHGERCKLNPENKID